MAIDSNPQVCSSLMGQNLFLKRYLSCRFAYVSNYGISMQCCELREKTVRKGIATIVRISSGDVVYIEDNSKSASKIAGFALGKIANYRGESVQELRRKGLELGRQVKVEYDDSDRVRSVQLVRA